MESSKIDSAECLDAQKLKESLKDEEKRLGNLEKQRLELVKELDKLEKDILKEKKKYRNLIDNKLTKELETLIKKHSEQPEGDIKECTSTHPLGIEKVDLELSMHLNGMQFDEFKPPTVPSIPKTSKDEYMKSIKSFLSGKGTKNSDIK